jgi:3-oxoacyl-[acyl-carrier protein] reductase
MTRPVAVVTGAASNIGLATARLFGDDHAVVLADLQDAAEAARAIGAHAVAVQGDVTNPADCARWIATAERHGALQSVVHAAAITAQPRPIDEIPLDEWERIIRVNLTGSFILMQAAMPALRRTPGSAAVLIASRAGKTGYAALALNPRATKAHYAASKAGVISLVKSLAMELAPDGVRVNGIAPGPIEGTMLPREQWAELAARVPLGRMGTPDEIAAAARFLCSPAASFITGHILDVNGGVLMD